MAFRYRVFGVNLQTSRLIPSLIPLEKDEKIDLYLYMGKNQLKENPNLSQELWYESPRDKDGNFLYIWKLDNGAFFRFQYSDGTTFIIDGSGNRIWAKWPKNLTFEDTTNYLLGHIMGFVLGLRGVTCLHASAIAVDDYAIAFLGPGGGGKSTVAAAFAMQGNPVLTDDIIALNDKGDVFLVEPGYPRLKLWSGTVETLFGIPDALPCISPEHPTWDKRYLDLTQNN